jgi:hypothetical protein
VTFFAFRFWAGCITSTLGFDLRQAHLTLLRVNHCIDQPDATTNDDDRSKQEKDIRGAAVTLIIVFVKLLLLLRHLYAFLFQFLILLCIFASSS